MRHVKKLCLLFFLILLAGVMILSVSCSGDANCGGLWGGSKVDRHVHIYKTPEGEQKSRHCHPDGEYSHSHKEWKEITEY